MEFIELCEAICQSKEYDVLPTTLYNYLKNKYPWELPQDAYKGINILCKCINIELRHNLIKTLFEFYYNNPIDINKSRIIHTLITKVQDDYLIKYIAELCLTSNYDPVIFNEDDFENMAFWDMLDSIKFIFNLSKYDEYKYIIRNINFSAMMRYAACGGSFTVPIYLIKFIKKHNIMPYYENDFYYYTNRCFNKYFKYVLNIASKTTKNDIIFI